jgi:UDP-N-acetylmuramoylalanine--D-glutamate ligase
MNRTEYRNGVKGRKITVFGAGSSGLAVARLLKRNGALVFVSEKKSETDAGEAAAFLSSAGIEAEFGFHSLRALGADWIVVSPGIPISTPPLKEAGKRGIPIFGELETASWFCDAPIVAVTGSNGKSTTTALLGEIFKASGKKTAVAGNIGRPFSEDAESLTPDGVAVLEVSSFQLETIRTFHPKAALFLNLTQDHLNRHGSLDVYGKIKARIFENQDPGDWLILNGRDERVTALSEGAKGKKSFFGIDKPGQDCGIVRNGKLVVRLDGREEILLDADDLGIRGEHNAANALAASLACRRMGIGSDVMAEVLRSFRGLPHRLEFVRELEGVSYVNDSKATNVDSVWYALNSFDRPIVLIAGGRDKDSDFTALRERISDKVRCIVLIGEAADKMEKAFKGTRPMVRAKSFVEAVRLARKQSERGDVVLLSPACASFDMFHNFEDRGDQFRAMVRALS